MNIIITPPESIVANISLPASKSVSNRILILNALSNSSNPIYNLAQCDDTDVMLRALATPRPNFIDIGAAGTSMRFLTAYLATTSGEWNITGTERMRQRPIAILVNALRQIGAHIEYTENEGYPPLHIYGKPLPGGTITLAGDISSQYISALLMIAPLLTKGLSLTLTGDILSRPYIAMTLSLMNSYGVKSQWLHNTIIVPPQTYIPPKQYTVESDWSAASYWYAMSALNTQSDITLQGLMPNSLQGDAHVTQLFEPMGVTTQFTPSGVVLKNNLCCTTLYEADLSAQPDLAQTIAVCCALKKIPFTLTGLQTLRIKETDRLSALQCELAKLGFIIHIIENHTLQWLGERQEYSATAIDTYHDHRMAMAFSLAAITEGRIIINNPQVVSKSYPNYWEDLTIANFNITKP